MRRTIRSRCLAAVLPLLASAALAQAGMPPDGSAGAPVSDDAGMALQLADGTVVRVPAANVAEKRFSGSYGATLDNASAIAGPRRVPLRRRTQVFDARTPGAVASIRG
ncbi:hypothetical protein ACIPRI_08020 [Variovorax sp. LARHSF232]